MYGLSVQDGGVEGHVLISCCESTKIATSCRTTIDRGHWNPPKKKKKAFVQRQRKSCNEMVGWAQTQ